MSQFARIVVPGVAHHVVHRGNRRQPIFFTDDDRRQYLGLLKALALPSGLRVWAYCLMTNHVHLVVVPERSDSLANAIGNAHRAYSLSINRRFGWRGHLWQGRFRSFPLEDSHLYAAVRYVELNPVRAGLTQSATEYRWSSAREHCGGPTTSILAPCPSLGDPREWRKVLADMAEHEAEARLARHTASGRPFGSSAFLENLEQETGRRLLPRPPGRPRCHTSKPAAAALSSSTPRARTSEESPLAPA